MRIEILFAGGRKKDKRQNETPHHCSLDAACRIHSRSYFGHCFYVLPFPTPLRYPLQQLEWLWHSLLPGSSWIILKTSTTISSILFFLPPLKTATSQAWPPNPLDYGALLLICFYNSPRRHLTSCQPECHCSPLKIHLFSVPTAIWQSVLDKFS